MSRLGTKTNSKKQWVNPQPNDSLGAGSVLMAEPGSFDHYFLESLVLILEHDDATGTRGVLLNHETPWFVDEMTAPGALGPLSTNGVFLGGDAGKDTMVMLHGEHELPGARDVGRGVYVGGVSNAARAVAEGALPPDRFKFFYKSVEWLPRQLEGQIGAGQFRLVELSPAWLFGQSGHRSMWQEVREQLPYLETAEGDNGGVTGAVAPGAATGLAYEKKVKQRPKKRDVAEEASRGVRHMRKGVEEHRQARDAEDSKLKE